MSCGWHLQLWNLTLYVQVFSDNLPLNIKFRKPRKTKQYWLGGFFRAPWITCDVAFLYNFVSQNSFEFSVDGCPSFGVSGVLNMFLTISQICGFLTRHNCNPFDCQWSYSLDPLDGYLQLSHLFTLSTDTY